MNIVKFDDQIKYHNDLGQRHRLDGPAVEYTNGSKFWYQNGKYHRLDGPAFEWSDGRCKYYIHGREYTELEFKFFSRVILTDTSDS